MRVLTARTPSKPAKATTVQWFEDEPIPYWDSLTAGVTNVATTFPVTNGTYHLPGSLILVTATGEVVRVTAQVGNNLTVTRGYATIPGTAASSAATLLNLSTAEMEGDVSPDAMATVKVVKSNFVQICRTPVHVTNTNQAVDHYSGDELPYLRRMAGERHARRWEEILLHGRKKEDLVTGAKAIRAAGGLDEHITTNVLDAGGVLTESEWIAWISDCFRFSVTPGRSSKLLLASQNLINTMNSWGLGKLQVNQMASTTYGMDIMTYICGFGKLNVVYHPLLEFGYEGFGYVIDPDGVVLRPLRPTKLKTNIQSPDEDAVKDEYITEATFEFRLEKAFGRVSNVQF